MRFIKYFTLLISLNLFAQKIQIFDDFTQTPIPYVTIETKTNKYLSDSLGKFVFEKNQPKDFKLYKENYQEKNITANEFNDKIFLQPKSIQIKSLNLNFKNKNEFGNKKGKGSVPLNNQMDFTILVENPKKQKCKILSLNFSVKSTDSISKNQFLEISFFENKNNKPYEKIETSQQVLVPIEKRHKNYKINLAKENLLFPESGIFTKLSLFSNIGEENNQVGRISLNTLPKSGKALAYIRKKTHTSWDNIVPLLDSGSSPLPTIPAISFDCICAE
ncbi:hypothetical protein ACQ1Q1_01065 [Ornithobacterium rhinotracheale]|uniref:Uncharacterized protein n=1 Tax=Ornithobacterium rhinotracheale (strain ATCC 51463 / DSM 15997 / CCUG 23171 / CIP 104009 / LMG 9086) TaxID=867902 RepID=I3ZXI8_ORNRL|nr:hypothetical protein [Ornithobacterium rhinotracheale]AFL96422.1 hypothetical protein Ornrh_0200 [Ornithobacterium rhinotracheale DSM 15997]